ncbi:MAG: type II/IV secretion system protein, partial [Candidatus Margulisbacteria bacterium]|nr:type II/IV secretion system protein [Candidatus Margulisiibacteriota bacterium]
MGYAIPHVDLPYFMIEENLLELIPGELARKHNIVPLFKINNTITVAISDPNNVDALDALQKQIKFTLLPVRAESKEITETLDSYYGILSNLDDAIGELKTLETQDDSRPKSKFQLSTEEEIDSPVIKLINLIFSQAILKKASDIHIEPGESFTMVRLRIDGEMEEVNKIPKIYHSSLVSRIKVIGNMDIAESRVPQDGHARVEMNDNSMELRISSLPTIHGENIVIRILNREHLSYGMEDLGMSKTHLESFMKLIQNTHGIILVTGPTGSGKTTTLYSALTEINDATRHIVTLEDPVEYQLPMVRQVQINTKTGLVFSSGLRSILRQDPDIILVGEIRDLETAELAIRASLTGHLVFSTLHTNDAVGAIIRLIDMGIEPFLVSSSVTAVLAQRLVKKICDNCKTHYKPSKEIMALLKLKKNKKYTKGTGCKQCRETGYSGRVAIFELFMMDDVLRRMIVEKNSATEIKEYAIKKGLKLMIEDARDKIYDGLVEPEQV